MTPLFGGKRWGPVLAAGPALKEAPVPALPKISPRAVIGTGSLIIGDIWIDDDVFIGFQNTLRANASPPYYIGPRSNLQDYVMMHCHPGEYVCVDGKKVGVWLEGENSVLHHAAIHGPLFVGKNTLIGQSASIYGAIIGRDCVIMHGAVVTGDVTIDDGRYVAPGQAVHTQRQADGLPRVPSRLKDLNREVVDYYYRVGKGYATQTDLAIPMG